MTTKNIGQEGFVWFIGVVEDREDPKKLGRVRVRPYNLYSSSSSHIPTSDLPWAIIMMSPTNPSSDKVGWSADRKSTRLNSSHSQQSRMPSSA